MSAGTSWVLVIDDDRDVRDLLCMLLEVSGYHVVAARDGREALEQLEGAARPSLILLDLMMPGLNGADFMTILRSDPELAEIPVIVISGRSTAPQVATALRADSLLMKPVDLDELLELIRRYVGDELHPT